MAGPYAVREVVESVPFGFGTGQKAEIKRWLVTKDDKAVQVSNRNLGVVPLLFDDPDVAAHLAGALNLAATTPERKEVTP